MRKLIRGKVLLAGTWMIGGLAALGQVSSPTKPAPTAFEVAVTFNPVLANIVNNGNTFWMQGGSVQAHGQFWHGLGAVADVAAVHTASMNSAGVGLDLVTATFGPRYTWSPKHRRLSFFGQVLAGEANGLNSVFPAPNRAESSASSLAVQAGGGMNLPLSRHIFVRAFEADWLRTQLPNTTTNVQNNLRLGTGLVFRFK